MAPDTSKMYLSSEDKLALLESFDLDTRHRTRTIRLALQTTLDAFTFRQETEIMNVPRELRNLNMSDLNAKWGGDWGRTMNRLKEEALRGKVVKSGTDARLGSGLAEDTVQEVIEEKRKRTRVEPEIGPGNVNKGSGTPSRFLSQTINGAIPPSTLKSKAKSLFSGKRSKPTSTAPAHLPSSLGTTTPHRTLKRGTRAHPASTLPASPAPLRGQQRNPTATPRGPLPPSGLSSAYALTSMKTFQPTLPRDLPSYVPLSTAKPPRAPRETDLLMSTNGSPLIWAPTPKAMQDYGQNKTPTQVGRSAYAVDEQGGTPGSVMTDDELPDPEEMEKRLLAASTRGAPIAEGRSAKLRLQGLAQDLVTTKSGSSQSAMSTKAKRISTIRIRQSSAHSQPSSFYGSHLRPPAPEAPQPRSHSAHTSPNRGPEKVQLHGTIMRITTNGGHIVEYDASKEKDMSEVDRELAEQGMGEEERLEVRRETEKKMRELEAMIRSFKF